MLNVVHIITTLETGGAQMMLLKLLQRMDRNEFTSDVVSLGPPGALTNSVAAVSRRVESMNIRPGMDALGAISRLGRYLRQIRPDVVQTWLYHADLLGGIAARLATTAPVLWNIRTSSLGEPSVTNRIVFRLMAGLSRIVPFEIVSCSLRARDTLIDLGYDRGRFVIVPNGFDVSAFKPDPAARIGVRRELGIPDAALLVGLVARWHPVKDHATFVRAAKRIVSSRADAYFLLCGDEVTSDNVALREMVNETGAADRFRLLGRRVDVARLTAALDAACSSSSSEAFSNSIGEAMASGVPVVATDVGDSATLVADTGLVVGPRDEAALAGAILSLLLLPPERRADLGTRARQRIEGNFEIGVVARRYQDLYRRVARRERSSGPSIPSSRQITIP